MCMCERGRERDVRVCGMCTQGVGMCRAYSVVWCVCVLHTAERVLSNKRSFKQDQNATLHH